jgi:protein phosphatase
MRHAAITDTGKVRPGNEDTIGVAADRGLFVIADGMGGHERGEVASRLAVDTVLEFLSHDLGVPPGPEETLDLLRAAAMYAHRRVLVENLDSNGAAAMGTTLTLAQVVDGNVHYAHVGDSRLLRIAPGGTVERMTRDQTLAQKLLDEGADPASVERRQHATLLQAIGLEGYLVPATGTEPVAPGETLVLCTDGLSDLVSEADIAATILGHGDDLDAAAADLVARANAKGGADNISVILVRP